jgi:hypothetical protein
MALVACGDDDDDEPTDSTEATTEDTEATDETTAEITVPDISISIPDISTPDISISIPDIDITIPDISIPDAEELIREIFPDLDDDQVSCLAEALQGEAPSASEVMDLLDDCNINASDLVPG